MTKLVKYLDRLGWSAVVVTASRINVPLIDQSMLKDVPSGTKVIRTSSLEPVSRSGPNKLQDRIRSLVNIPMIPNVTALWAVCAALPALKAAKDYKPAAILCSAPEFPAFLVGVAVKARTGLPLVLDYRDEWSYHPERMQSIKGSKLKTIKQGIEERLERRTAAQADRIIANTSAFADMFTTRLKVPADKVRVITNGFDPADFENAPAEEPHKDKPVITHLGSIDHVSLFPPLIIEALDRAAAELDKDVEFCMAGRVFPELREIIEGINVHRVKIRFTGFLPADRAFHLLRQSDLNIQVNELLPGKERYHNLKLFDYLYSEKPIVVYGHKKSEIAAVAQRSGLAEVVEPGDRESLERFFHRFLKGEIRTRPDRDYIRSFAWPNLAEKAAKLLEQITDS